MARNMSATSEPANGPRHRRHLHSADPNERIRVTLVIPYALDRNIEACSLKEGRLKHEVVKDALESYLVARSFSPDKLPKIEVSY